MLFLGAMSLVPWNDIRCPSEHVTQHHVANRTAIGNDYHRHRTQEFFLPVAMQLTTADNTHRPPDATKRASTINTSHHPKPFPYPPLHNNFPYFVFLYKRYFVILQRDSRMPSGARGHAGGLIAVGDILDNLCPRAEERTFSKRYLRVIESRKFELYQKIPQRGVHVGCIVHRCYIHDGVG